MYVAIAFFESCQSLLVDKLQTNLGDLPIDHGRSLQEYREQIQSLFTDIYTSYHRLFLYLSNADSVVEKASKVVEAVQEIQIIFKRHFDKVKMSLVFEGRAHFEETSESYRRKVEESDIIVKAYWQEMKPALAVAGNAFSNYLEELNSHFLKSGRDIGIESLYAIYFGRVDSLG
ncbi:MAG: hypothetical protein GY850_34245 [bacterium]|nr:hypothetical protein [bacterium]